MPTIQNGSIQLIDPNDVVSALPENLNGTPQYQSMFIFAELTAERRGRSILTSNFSNGRVDVEQSTNDVKINLMGVDSNVNDSNDIKLTTRWTNNVTNTITPLEGFGMSKIDVEINSSFIPQVTIEFVDIRGMAFFNLGQNSPYSVLFDFPPPIFNLTLKGYYGKALEYQLHLVRHSTNFDSKTGNYITSVDFIARTFAPLTDIPFKLIDIFPLIDQQTVESIDPKLQQQVVGNASTEINTDQLNVDERVAPRNTHELILKLRSLYDNINELRNNSTESDAIKESQKQLNQGIDLLDRLNNFDVILSNSVRSGAAIIIKEAEDNDGDTTGKARIVQNISEYDNVIRSDENEGINAINKNERLFLGILERPNVSGDTEIETTEFTNAVANIDEQLLNVRTDILNKATDFITVNEGDVSQPETEILDLDLSLERNTNEDVRYRVIDITSLYMKLYKYLNIKRTDIDDAKVTLVGKINQSAIQNLGMLPTAYNIFKIMCDDIDTFFNILRKTGVDAETHHEKFANLILTEVKDTRIGPFPLYTQLTAATDCSVSREVRAYPSELSRKLDEPFPEVRLVENFIAAFIEQEKEELVRDLRIQEDENGNNKWIPVTPLDSVLSGNLDFSSPYANIELNGQEGTIIDSIYNTILSRFYIASQYTYGRDFYKAENSNIFRFLGFGDRELKRTDLIRFVAGADAVNLANSLVNETTISSLSRNAQLFKSNPDLFYSSLEENNISNYASIVPSDQLFLDQQTIPLYKNRNNVNFDGFTILQNNQLPAIRQDGDTNTQNLINPVDKYIENNTTFWQDIVNSIFPSDENRSKEFTTENVPYFGDIAFNNQSYATRFVSRTVQVANTVVTTNSLVNIWANLLAFNDTGILSFLTDTNVSDHSKAFWLVSTFGFSLSYFDNDVNNQFRTPALVEVPELSIFYMGGLISYFNNLNNVKTDIDAIYGEGGIAFDGRFPQTQIINDSELINQLSVIDRNTFLSEFNSFVSDSNGYIEVLNRTVELINSVQDLIANGDLDDTEFAKNGRYVNQLRGAYVSIMTTLSNRNGILNHNTYTFSNDENVDDTYIPLATTNEDTTTGGNKTANDLYFTEFFTVLNRFLPQKDDELKDLEVSFRSNISDNDIKNQLYYTFKALSDKWISGLGADINKGFPLNRGANDPLINKFVFVDRAMNPIGNEVILNVESLIDLSQDYDINVFTVFSKLLSLNGFEIFPLQNFMVHTSDDWNNAFKIFETADQAATPAFVCMYIGGTSSTLNSVNSEFDDDGILDLGAEDLPDYKNSDCSNSPEAIDKETAQVNNNSERFQYSQVKAFRVRYAEQNQSFFTGIKLDSREFPETAESLAILSRIAGDESQSSPVPKGQNLFNIYENRAYSATVSMLGNMMIQPTQYFQLENIPMYSGAYIILDVNHTVTANHMVTQFQGTRILKYPNPIVKNFATVIGINSGSAEDTSSNRLLERTGSIILENGQVLVPEMQHNSLYSLSIR